MAALTIRNIDDDTKKALRIRAARRGVSMEQEARVILRDALQSEVRSISSGDAPGKNLYDSIRALVEPYGGFEIDIPPRSKSMREPPKFE